jgi:hypothetical protein
VCLGKRDEVINIKVTRIGERLACERVEPGANDNSTTPGVKLHWSDALCNQDFLSSILAVSIGIYPTAVKVTVVGDSRRWGWCGRDRLRGVRLRTA